jgi:hypothetical protein
VQSFTAISFLNVTKYPPSLAFVLLTLGLNGLILFSFMKYETGLKKCVKPLVIFGQTALFFYVVHLFLYAFMGFAFPMGTDYGWLYLTWLAGLLILYPLCVSYKRFKEKKPPDSVWRFF